MTSFSILLAVGMLVVFVVLKGYTTRGMDLLRHECARLIAEEKRLRHERAQEQILVESFEAKRSQAQFKVRKFAEELGELNGQVKKIENELGVVSLDDEEVASLDDKEGGKGVDG